MDTKKNTFKLSYILIAILSLLNLYQLVSTMGNKTQSSDNTHSISSEREQYISELEEHKRDSEIIINNLFQNLTRKDIKALKANIENSSPEIKIVNYSDNEFSIGIIIFKQESNKFRIKT